MRAVEWVCRMVAPSKGRRGRRRPRVRAATTPVTPPPAVTPATVPPLAVPYDAPTVALPRIAAHPYKQETR